jgi:hypothetical protein
MKIGFWGSWEVFRDSINRFSTFLFFLCIFVFIFSSTRGRPYNTVEMIRWVISLDIDIRCFYHPFISIFHHSLFEFTLKSMNSKSLPRRYKNHEFYKFNIINKLIIVQFVPFVLLWCPDRRRDWSRLIFRSFT